MPSWPTRGKEYLSLLCKWRLLGRDGVLGAELLCAISSSPTRACLRGSPDALPSATVATGGPWRDSARRAPPCPQPRRNIIIPAGAFCYCYNMLTVLARH